MKIGIDARFLTHDQSGGFKTYTANLIEALSKVDGDNEYVIYLDRVPAEQIILPQVDNFIYKVVPLRFPGIGMPFREQIDLLRQIHKDNLDLVHFPCNTAPVNIAQKYVVTLHDVIQVDNYENNPFRIRRNLSEQKQWALTAYSRWTIQKTAVNAGRVVTVSRYEKEKISQRLDIPLEKICVTHLAPGTVFKPVSQETREAKRKQVCSDLGLCDRFIMGVGYESRKNIPLLIRSFSIVAASHPDLSLVVVAANAAKQRHFQQLASELGHNGRVHILGRQSPEELAVLCNLAEIFVFPSERESFGLPPLEAIACGTPTIATNGSSLSEVLAEGALLVDGQDVGIWANAISSVMDNEGLQASLVERGLVRSRQLSWQNCAEKTIDIYKMVHLGPDDNPNHGG